ncbi:hypothetical protein F2P81_023268 [Scophthalmus maximus]|uniref:Uncharacterized protein n=1 Tax=Scophthalmus maximus TaxID=52904 RepID=A0A6A4RPH2_SCOMX|nr:hypothetical protein F2P81_023268 [Scophthalmus maximus]
MSVLLIFLQLNHGEKCHDIRTARPPCFFGRSDRKTLWLLRYQPGSHPERDKAREEKGPVPRLESNALSLFDGHTRILALHQRNRSREQDAERLKPLACVAVVAVSDDTISIECQYTLYVKQSQSTQVSAVARIPFPMATLEKARQKEKEQMEALRKHHAEEIEHHKKEIERLGKEIDRHKGKIRKLKHDD